MANQVAARSFFAKPRAKGAASDDQAVADQPGKQATGVGDGAIYRIALKR
jgi:hypothetical protein